MRAGEWWTHREILRASTANLLTPNLRLVAKHDPRDSDDEVCKLIGLVLALTVQVRRVKERSQLFSQITETKVLRWVVFLTCGAQSPKKQEHIARIQKLDEWVQRELMYSIEQASFPFPHHSSASVVPRADLARRFCR